MDSPGSKGTTPAELERKSHGRNGARAYINAKHYFHALVMGALGAICEACGIGHMSPIERS